MICREVTEFLADFESKSLEPPVQREFEQHLARCPDCCTFLAQYQHTVNAGKRACAEQDADAATEIPEPLLHAIMAAIRAQKH